MQEYTVSIRCYYPNGNRSTHHQRMKLNAIRKWIEAYAFTHPQCEALSVKVWLHEGEKEERHADEE